MNFRKNNLLHVGHSRQFVHLDKERAIEWILLCLGILSCLPEMFVDLMKP